MLSFASRFALLACAMTLFATPAGAGALYRATTLTERNDTQPVVEGLDDNGRIMFWNWYAPKGAPEHSVYNPKDGAFAPLTIDRVGETTRDYVPQHMSPNGRMTTGWAGGKPVVSDGGRTTELPAWGQAVNDSGQVAVTNIVPNATTSAIVSNGTVTPLDLVPGYDSIGIGGLNNLGQASGTVTYFPSGSGDHRTEPIFYDGRNVIPLGTFGGVLGYGAGLNNKGDVIGSADAVSTYGIGFASHQGGPLVPLLVPGDDVARFQPSSINDAGQIVGQVVNGSGRTYLYENGTLPTDLNDLLSPSANVRVTDAYFINNHSQIVAKGFLDGEKWPRLFLLTPEDQAQPRTPGELMQIVPEPSTLVVFGLVLVGAATLRRRRAA